MKSRTRAVRVVARSNWSKKTKEMWKSIIDWYDPLIGKPSKYDWREQEIDDQQAHLDEVNA